MRKKEHFDLELLDITIFLQDVVLPTPSVFEENMLSTLSSFVFFNKVLLPLYRILECILFHLKTLRWRLCP